MKRYEEARHGDPARAARNIRPLFLIFALVVFAAVGMVGCSASGGAESTDISRDEITIGHTGWAESEAISALSKVLLEDELGYDRVELRRVELTMGIASVARADLDVFQDVWTPIRQAALDAAPGDVRLMDSWLVGTTRSSLAVPSYMDVRSLDKLRSTSAKRVLLLRPDASPLVEVPSEALKRYGLKPETYPDAASMLKEVHLLYEDRKPFVFLAWTPHWMNQEYEFNYVEDPKGVLGDLTQPAHPRTVFRKGLSGDDPVAFTLLSSITLTESRATELQIDIHKADDPEKGARNWVHDHRKLTDSWVDAAKEHGS